MNTELAYSIKAACGVLYNGYNYTMKQIEEFLRHVKDNNLIVSDGYIKQSTIHNWMENK